MPIGLNTTKVLALTGAATSSGSTPLALPSRTDEMTVQVEISGTGTVIIEGRIAEDAPWFTLATITASTIQPLAAVTSARARVTANSANVNVWIASR